MTWCNAEFTVRDQEHRHVKVEKHIRSVLAHFMLPDGRAACGFVPTERTRMLPEDTSARGAFHCAVCAMTRGR